MARAIPTNSFDTPAPPLEPHGFLAQVRSFSEHGAPADESRLEIESARGPSSFPVFTNEFWTARQRAAHSLHEISYRACFKPQLPRFFISRLTRENDVVYDPFMGRGTTVLEAALLGRRAFGCDVNPLSALLVRPRLFPPDYAAVQARLASLDLRAAADLPHELLVFFHPDTLREIAALRAYLIQRVETGQLDATDDWIRMVAVNRLTGHSPGFFSVYTMPPNQAVTAEAQRKLNARRKQSPPLRDVRALILKKTASLLKDCDHATHTRLAALGPSARLVTGDAEYTPALPDASVDLVVTSPPFLDVVNYAQDNWLRGWFIGVEADRVPITILRRVEEWQAKMSRVFRELARVVRPGGHVAFEVGEVKGGTVRLEEHVIPAAQFAGFKCLAVLIHQQQFTKTANTWGVSNNRKGTNTNRIVVLER